MNGKTPKGTIDLYGEAYEMMSSYKEKLETLFKQYGGNGLETPQFELRQNLTGEDEKDKEITKLIYNIEDDGSPSSEKYALRYDLTVPKVRFSIANNVTKDRIYSIGKVYRRDNPAKGRYREFYQADFDIIGEADNEVLNECMLLKMATEFLSSISILPSQYTIYVNDTRYLKNLLLSIVEIREDQFKSVCSTIDKLDKCKFDTLLVELQQKGLSDIQIEKLRDVLNNNQNDQNDKKEQIDALIEYAKCFGFADSIQFLPSLARGLDYYDGLIYEIKLNAFPSTIISGGRYDGLIPSVSAVGISFGLSRLMDFMKMKNKKEECKNEEWRDIYLLTSIIDEKEMNLQKKMEYAAKCEKKMNIKMMVNTKEKKLVKTINYCLQNKIRYLVIIAENELKDNKVIVKDLKNNTQSLFSL